MRPDRAGHARCAHGRQAGRRAGRVRRADRPDRVTPADAGVLAGRCGRIRRSCSVPRRSSTEVAGASEALELANSSPFGLGGVVCSADPARAREVATCSRPAWCESVALGFDGRPAVRQDQALRRRAFGKAGYTLGAWRGLVHDGAVAACDLGLVEGGVGGAQRFVVRLGARVEERGADADGGRNPVGAGGV
jgi:hypothetical protein